MRCNDCSKFVSHEARAEFDQEPEVDGTEITAVIRLILECAECGAELADYSEDVSASLETPVDGDGQEIDAEWEIENDDPEVEDYYEGQDKKGKPYPARYQKHMYKGTCEVRCSYERDETETIEDTVTLETSPVQASWFNSLQ